MMGQIYCNSKLIQLSQNLNNLRTADEQTEAKLEEWMANNALNSRGKKAGTKQPNSLPINIGPKKEESDDDKSSKEELSENSSLETDP